MGIGDWALGIGRWGLGIGINSSLSSLSSLSSHTSHTLFQSPIIVTDFNVFLQSVNIALLLSPSCCIAQY
ncbi:hypothetical protein B4U84_18435 [Westiellopsis prolifica IICB1]|nr:hypothetical protein B4U84_18435 [Westiellopsis prolifica IICB1]